MLPVMQFIFSSFWVWLGTMLLIVAAGAALGEIIGYIVYRIGRMRK